MSISFELIKDKVEFFEAVDLSTLEKNISEQIELNQSIMLRVHHVQHHVTVDEHGRRLYTAVVHFKLNQ
ncbi:DUF2536 family protein [Rossellomorea marisflavi]|uniref:DUF2536 family protein n=1 Tax=Rossellomorea marisflavi TaxID=189381 RepID=UPI001318A35A|nr:DUF2536 family protein [Rossellomorea marisflavi]QHA37057.1 DUF2536 family protein [Rossellomorea marisflavi]